MGGPPGAHVTAREDELRRVLTGAGRGDVSGLAADDDLVAELGLDSLAGLRLLAAVEKHYGVRFPDQELGRLRTIRQLLDAIESAPREEGEE